MSSNPYAKKFGASAREQKRQSDADSLYSFDPSAAANDLIAATIGAAHAGGASAGVGAGGGYGSNAGGYDGGFSVRQ